MMTDRPRFFIRFVLPVIVLFVAAAIAALIFVNRPQPHPAPAAVKEPPLVDALVIRAHEVPLETLAQGTVAPKTQIQFSAQVAGQIVGIASVFTEGGLFVKDDTLVQIESADYQLALKQARAQLKQAEYSLTLAKAGQEVARSDLQMFRQSRSSSLDAPSSASGSEETGVLAAESPLALYEPQVENAEAAVESARAAVERAQLNLQRTRILAPFHGRIRHKNVDVGQFVSPGSPLATIYARSPLTIQVSLPLSDLQWITRNRPTDALLDLPVLVMAAIDSQTHTWQGILTRTLGELDNVGRQAQFVVEVSNTASDLGLELKVGMFVDVSIRGEGLHGVMTIPQRALTRDQTVWVIRNDETLEQRAVSIGRSNREEVVVTQGLSEGERIVSSMLPEALPGMKVKVRSAPQEISP
jgi:RND family efflux transporter MFP subunit